MTPPRLRHAARHDLDALLALYGQLNHGDLPAPRDRLAAILARIVDSEDFALVVATQDDVVVATCYLNIIPNLSRGGASYAVIENVVVEAGRRGTGLGRSVMRFALDEAWRRGCYKVLLQTGERDPRVHRFYESCGFSASEKTGFVARPASLRPLSERWAARSSGSATRASSDPGSPQAMPAIVRTTVGPSPAACGARSSVLRCMA